MARAPLQLAPPPGGELPPDLSWKEKLIYDGRGGLKDCRENVVHMLRHHEEWREVLAADVFAKRIVTRKASPLGHEPGHVWTPDDDVELGLWFTQNRREPLLVRSEETLARGVAFVAKESPFHPVREMLEGLEWDYEPRMDSWMAKYLGASPTVYTSRVGRYFLLNLVRRVYEPGCVMRSVVVLEGAQNIGKSTVPRLLAQPWFSDTLFDLTSKDVFQLIQGVWLYEVSELDSFSKADATRVKAFISSTKDRFRAPYDRAPQDQPREACFVATTNASEYLRDWTGNTRFHPVLCAEIDLAGLAKVRDQLLAEAAAIYRAGGEAARAYPTRSEEEEYFAPEQEQRLSMHPWFYEISDWLAENTHVDSVTVNEVIRGALHIGVSDMGRNAMAEQIVGKTLSKLGWTRRRDTKPDAGGQRPWRWYRPPRAEPPKVDPDEVPF